MRIRFAIMDAAKLRPHERVDANLLLKLSELIQADGALEKPIAVAEGYYVILDGHHRYHALLALGCTKVPVYLIDYSSDDITLTTWPGAAVARVTKQEVIARAGGSALFPPKTTRHLFPEPLPDHPVPLADLRPSPPRAPPRTSATAADVSGGEASRTPRTRLPLPTRRTPRRVGGRTPGSGRKAGVPRPGSGRRGVRGGSRKPRSR